MLQNVSVIMQNVSVYTLSSNLCTHCENLLPKKLSRTDNVVVNMVRTLEQNLDSKLLEGQWCNGRGMTSDTSSSLSVVSWLMYYWK